jgi:hypothetical protein
LITDAVRTGARADADGGGAFRSALRSFFHPTDRRWSTYDFIACTETVEHFHKPANSCASMRRCVRGILAISDALLTDDVPFDDRHYRKDPTHVVFYRERRSAESPGGRPAVSSRQTW